ncbi:MAG TPA: hypothetical protein VMJ32_10880 [Pirellulales bacterium]|nr:hypothetical protein [Pirellulales bacterium]
MFPLHERTRRFICRTLFLLCGVLPTATVLAWCIRVNSAAQATAVRAQLESALGLKVQLSAVAFPRPGCTLLHGVELLDPDSGETIAAARLVELNENASGIILATLSQPELQLSHAAALKALVDRRLHGWASDIRLVGSELTLHWPGGDQTLVDCGAFFENSSDAQRTSFVFRLPNTPDADASRQIVQFQRHSVTAAPDARAAAGVNDGGNNCDIVIQSLPYPVVCATLGLENHLGSDCLCSAKIRACETPDGWQAEVTAGGLQNIDLHRLVSEQFPHQMSGVAEATINHALFHAGRLEEATGSIHAGPGVVSGSLLRSAAEFLRMRAGGTIRDDELLPYAECSAAFVLDTKGLAIHGHCQQSEPGAVIRAGNAMLLAESGGAPVPVVALIKMLVPDSRVQVPATRQTDWLQRMLPVPDVVPGDPQSPPQARLRGGRDLH